jgi:hypothetical protein
VFLAIRQTQERLVILVLQEILDLQEILALQETREHKALQETLAL